MIDDIRQANAKLTQAKRESRDSVITARSASVERLTTIERWNASHPPDEQISVEFDRRLIELADQTLATLEGDDAAEYWRLSLQVFVVAQQLPKLPASSQSFL